MYSTYMYMLCPCTILLYIYVSDAVMQKHIGRLFLTVVAAGDLKSSKPVERLRPFCQVTLQHQPVGSSNVILQTLNTPHICGNANPTWMHHMHLNFSSLAENFVLITIYDREFFSPNGMFHSIPFFIDEVHFLVKFRS